MDDKTFIAAYVAKESQRINEALQEMIASETPPTEAQKDQIIQDIEMTLQRLKSALSFATQDISVDEEDGEIFS